MDTGQIAASCHCRHTLPQHTPDWFVVLAEEIIALIGNWYPALIWVNRAEWEVLRSSLAFGQHIEKGGFPAAGSQESVNRSTITHHE